MQQLGPAMPSTFILRGIGAKRALPMPDLN
jgi:hypothetical protein